MKRKPSNPWTVTTDHGVGGTIEDGVAVLINPHGQRALIGKPWRLELLNWIVKRLNKEKIKP